MPRKASYTNQKVFTIKVKRLQLLPPKASYTNQKVFTSLETITAKCLQLLPPKALGTNQKVFTIEVLNLASKGIIYKSKGFYNLS